MERLKTLDRTKWLFLILLPMIGVQSAHANPESGSTFRDCDVCPEMVVIPAGSFVMGSPEGSLGSETPQRTVTFSRPFAVGKFTVTIEQWESFVREAQYSDGNVAYCDAFYSNALGSVSKQIPMTCVSWHEAKGYTEWLSDKTGKNYRLLSEAEWEYVARAGSTGPYPFANFLIARHANIEGDADGYETIAPVGSFPSNSFGLHDMHGNVREWVQDCWNINYEGAPANGAAWLTGNCDERVGRGGDWMSRDGGASSVFRSTGSLDGRGFTTGFRVARDL